MRLLILIVLISKNVWALSCINPYSGLTTTLIQTPTELQFSFRAHRGYASIPQYEGPLSQDQLSLAKYQIESLTEINTGFNISVPVSECDMKRFSEGIFSCNSVGKIPGTQLTFSLIKGYREKQMHDFGDYEIQNFKIMIKKDDTFFFHIPFPKESCGY
jgi:hypothetical protein